MGGKTVKAKNATVSSAYGKTLREHGLEVDSLAFEYEYDELDKNNPEHVTEAKKELDDDDIVSVVNAKRSAKARAKAQEKILRENKIEPPAKDDPEVVRKNLIKTMVLGGLTEEQATSMAESILQAGKGNAGQ